MTSVPERPPLIPVKMLSDVLSALGVYAEVPTDDERAEAERAEETAALTARLANALYGSVLAHVMTAEYAAFQAGVDGHRQEALKLLLEICTVRRPDDPRFGGLHTNLAQAGTELHEAGDRLDALLATTHVAQPDTPQNIR